jgi:pyruvate/2-oxoacid:ferredoxin oxidoreductase alpha subunit
MFRPFPESLVQDRLKTVPKVAVVDRNFSFGSGGIFAQEVKAAISGMSKRPAVFSYIAGLGGRDVTPIILTRIYQMTKDSQDAQNRDIWVDLNEAEAGV